MQEVSLPAIVRRYFSTRHFSFRGKRLPIKCAFCCEKKRNRERESYAEVLSTRLWSAALKLGQWHLTSLTKNKSFFFFLQTVERKEYRKRKVFPIEYEPECEQFRAFSSSSTGWLISLYDTQWWKQTEKHFQGIKQGCVLHSLTEQRDKLERVLLHCM